MFYVMGESGFFSKHFDLIYVFVISKRKFRDRYYGCVPIVGASIDFSSLFENLSCNGYYCLEN